MADEEVGESLIVYILASSHKHKILNVQESRPVANHFFYSKVSIGDI